MTLRARGPRLHSEGFARALRRGDERIAARIAALQQQPERPCGHGSEYWADCPECFAAIAEADRR